MKKTITIPIQKTEPTKNQPIAGTESFNIENEQKSNPIADLKNDYNSKKQTGSGSKKSGYYKSKREAEKQKKEFSESISGVGSFTLNLIIQRLPNPLPLTKDEASAFDTMFSRVVYKYSELLGSYQEEFALASIGLMIIVPRLQKNNKKTDEKNVQSKKKD